MRKKQIANPATRAKAVGDRVLEQIDTYGTALDKRLSGTVPGFHELTGPEFIAWFNWMAMTNPNWVQALPYVKGGPELLSRFATASTRALEEMGVPDALS